jgi:hypothetical protein
LLLQDANQPALQAQPLAPNAFTDPRFLLAAFDSPGDSLWAVRTYGRIALTDSTELHLLELEGRLMGVQPNRLLLGLPLNPFTGRTRRPVVLATRYSLPRLQHHSATWFTQLVPGGPPELLLRARIRSTGARGTEAREENLFAAWDAETGRFRPITVANEAQVLAAHPLPE